MSTYPRRDFLFWLARAVALTAGAAGTAAGCGGSGGGSGGGNASTPSLSALTTPTPVPTPIATPIPTTPPLSGVPVQVSLAEIGGGDLTIPSLYQGQIAVGSGGIAALTQSTVGAQLHLVTDPLGKLRAAAITVPSLFGTAAPAIVFDARTTALALIFLTPGILTVDPTEAAKRLAQIATLSDFSALVTFLGQNLPLTALGDLATGTTLPNLMSGCIGQYFLSSPGTRAVSRRTTRRGQTELTSDIFSAQWLTGTLANGEPVFEGLNDAWRWTSVVAQKLAADGTTETGPPVALAFTGTGFGAVAGAALDGPFPAHSWSEFASDSAPIADSGAGTTTAGIANDHATAVLRLWVYGPGGTSSETVAAPAAIDALQAKAAAWGQSILGYIVAPLMDLILGGPILLPHGPALIDVVWNQIGASVSIEDFTSGSITAAFGAAFPDAIKAALTPLPNLVVPAIAANALSAIAPASVSAAEEGLALSIGTLMPAHLMHLLTVWSKAPVSAMYDLTVSSVGIGIQ
jgi:hypothetical protein